MFPRNHVFYTDGDEDRTNQFAAAWDDKSAMRPFAKLLQTLVIIMVKHIV